MAEKVEHPFFFGNSVKSNYIYTDEKTTTFVDLLNKIVVHEIFSPSYEEYHALERKKQQDVKADILKYILPVSMISLQRKSEFANRIELIILDIDEGKGLEIVELHDTLRELDLNHWIYTTISHTPESPKFRIIVEADGQMTPDLYNHCILDIAAKLNLTVGPPKAKCNVDSTSRDVVHAMFLPSKFQSNPEAFEEIKYFEGRAFSKSDIDWSRVETIIDRLSLSREENSISYSQPPMEGLTVETINTVLKQIQHMAREYDDWLRVGMAIHHQFRGGDEGLSIWDSWSRMYGEEKYDKEDLVKTWNSFSGHRDISSRALTFRSCFTWAMQEDWKPTLTRDDLTPLFMEIQELRKQEQTPEEIRIAIDALAERIRFTPMAPEHRDELVLEATALAKDYTLPFTKGYFSKKFAYANVLSLSRNQAPTWCKNHVYLSAIDMIYMPEKGYAVKENAYNNTFNSIIRDSMAYDPEANTKSTKVKPSPWERALDWYHIPKVDDIRFAPGKKEIFREAGGIFYNSYRREKVFPKPREQWSNAELEYIEKLRDHLIWMFPPHHIRTILSFLAVTIFEPQTKIRWACVLHSDAQGIGKSLFDGIARTCMGGQLISNVKSRQLTELSTKWKDNKKLVIVEEANLNGAVMEDLKDDISNNRMVVRSMYKDAVEVPNYVNFIFISNNFDGVEIKSERDRRYYIASSPIRTRSDMYKRLRDIGVDDDEVLAEMQRNKEFGVDDDDLSETQQLTKSAFSKHIFDDLFGGLERYQTAVCGWMLEVYRKNSDSFDRASPRLTDEFKQLARSYDDSLEGAIMQVIDDGLSPVVNNDYVIVKELFSILKSDNPAFKEYHLPDWVLRKYHISTVNSFRSIMIRKFGFKDVHSFIQSANNKKIRHRVLSRNPHFWTQYRDKSSFSELEERVKKDYIRALGHTESQEKN